MPGTIAVTVAVFFGPVVVLVIVKAGVAAVAVPAVAAVSAE